MKICKKCNAYNSDNRRYCVDCQTILGESISKEEELAVRENMDKKMNKLYRRDDPFYVDVYDKIIGVTSIAGLIILITVKFIIYMTNKLDEHSTLGFIVFVAAIFISLFPQIGWGIEKIRLSFIISNADDVTPSYFYFICRKTSAFILTSTGIATIAYMIGILLGES